MKSTHSSSALKEHLNSLLLIAAAQDPRGEVRDRDGLTQAVAELLDRGADVDGRNFNGVTALMVAAQNGHTETVAKLLALGANVNRAASNGATALMVAAQDGHTQTVAELLAKGADFNARASHGGTALMVAAQKGHTKTVAELLARGADANPAASNGVTALIVAAQNGHAETVLAFLSRDGADWQAVQDQLRHPALRNLNKEVSFLLAVIIPDKELPDKELRNSIIESFNQRNPDNKINQENNDILGAGLEAYKTLKDLKSWHVRYLTDSGAAQNEVKISANQRFFDLLNHQGAREEALARNDLVTELVFQSTSLVIHSGLGDENALGPVRRLNQEDFHKLITKIIDSGKDESGIPKLKDSLVVAELRKDRIDHPRTEISPASAARMKGQAGPCIVS